MADALDELYDAPLPDFTAVRSRLAAAAKKGGDAAAAKRIAAARKPTAAAWAVNRLVHRDAAARDRLTDLGERLRTAHAAMDGLTIRELTHEQRRLVDELAGAALREVDRPSSALRDDVVATLQAAVADPDVAARLGRLVKAEQWSGFGDFGAVTAVTRPKPHPKPEPARTPEPAPQPKPARTPKPDRAALAAVAEAKSALATARLRRDDARARVAAAEQALGSAEQAMEAAEQALTEAERAYDEAKRKL
jgi:3-oxoacyl-(acyl-carrier-protein) synthase